MRFFKKDQCKVLVQTWLFFRVSFQAIQTRKICFMIFQSKKNAILDYNTRSLKSRKIEIFPKGLVYGLGPKLVIFHVSFFGKLEQESVLYDILGRKSDILGYKSKKLKSLNIEIFPNGLVHCFGPKLAIFSCFFFRNLDQVNAFYYILERKNAILTYKTRSLKSQKMSQSMVLVQNWPFFHVSFLGNLDQENMFYDVLERKNAILGFENKNLKKPKN